MSYQLSYYDFNNQEILVDMKTTIRIFAEKRAIVFILNAADYNKEGFCIVDNNGNEIDHEDFFIHNSNV